MENRKYPRIQLCSAVEVRWDTNKSVLMKTHDVSDGGVLLTGSKLPELPPINTSVTIKLVDNIEGEESPLVPATVIRVTDEGIALEFKIDNS